MSEPSTSASPDAHDNTNDNTNGNSAADERPRLTEKEKKQNHIASEQKRRQAIREGFDRLTQLVPGMEGQARSEGVVLKRTVEFMREQLEERKRLIDAVESRGGQVDPSLKKFLEDSLENQKKPLHKKK